MKLRGINVDTGERVGPETGSHEELTDQVGRLVRIGLVRRVQEQLFNEDQGGWLPTGYVFRARAELHGPREPGALALRPARRRQLREMRVRSAG